MSTAEGPATSPRRLASPVRRIGASGMRTA
jgi:hypothetical protein